MNDTLLSAEEVVKRLHPDAVDLDFLDVRDVRRLDGCARVYIK